MQAFVCFKGFLVRWEKDEIIMSINNARGYKIVTDTTSDLPLRYYKDNDIISMALSFSINGVEYAGSRGKNVDVKEFYSKLRSGAVAKTSQASPDKVIELFKSIVSSGSDILYIGFSSGLSGTFQSVQMAKAEIEDEFPHSRILVVDSLSASLGQGLLVDFAVNIYNEQKQSGEFDIVKTYNLIEGIKLSICHYFTVDDLNHLFRGGRVSKGEAFFGTLLGIKPVLCVNNEGKLVNIGKVRGRKQSLDALVQKMIVKTEDVGDRNKYVFIAHGDCEKDALYLADRIKSVFGIPAKIINHIGPVIGAHSGPGTVALFFIGADRDENGA